MKQDLIMLFKAFLVFLIGTGLHFLYDVLRGFVGIAWLCPVNESMWEHLKLCYYPFLIYGVLFLWWEKQKEEKWSMENSANPRERNPGQLDFKGFVTGLMKASFYSILIVVAGHYTGLGGFLLCGPWWDIPLYAVSLIVGTIVWNRKKQDTSIPVIMAVLYHIIVIAGFAYFTWCPGEFPIFQDFS